MGEEIRLPRNLLDFAGDEHQISILAAGAPRAANHSLGNVHSHDASPGNMFCQAPRKPARSAPDIEYIVSGCKPHFFEHWQCNGQVLLLHALAAPGFRPALKLFPQHLARLRLRRAWFRRIGQLHRPAAVRAYLRARRRESTAAAAESAGAHRNAVHLKSFAFRHRPDHGDPPADHGPTKKEVHQKNDKSVFQQNDRDNRGQKIEKHHKNHKLHALTSSTQTLLLTHHVSLKPSYAVTATCEGAVSGC